ncbi:MAG TPA: damage-inducible protein CinA, partial [Armatimonadetes bacterium]|nr:damage-inducible protein CinA [Armatimonadota bacterium]
GIAGPTGGTPTTPVGTVFIALADDASTICEHHLFGGGRRAIKERACKTALNLIRKRLLNLHSETGGG